MKPPTGSRRRVWDATRDGSGKKLEEIVAAAGRVFERKGYADATIEDVANEVGLLKGSLYYYIKTKEDLLYAVVRQPIEVVVARLRQIAASAHSPVEKLELAIQSHVELVREYRSQMFVYLQVKWLQTDNGGEIARLGKEYEHLLQSILEEGKATGDFAADMEPKLISYAILGIFNWMQRWYSPRGPQDLETIYRQFGSLVLRGLVRE